MMQLTLDFSFDNPTHLTTLRKTSLFRRYGLLQEALQNRGILALQQPTQAAISKPLFADDPVETLAKLKRMLDQSLIAEAEYQAKKSEMVPRI